MRNTISKLLVSISIIFTNFVSADGVDIVKHNFTELPKEIRSAIDSADPVYILSIDGDEKVESQVLYVDELIIQKNSSITFTNLDHSLLAIVAKRVRVLDKTSTFSIRRIGPWKNLDGKNGKNGADGSRGKREGKHGGNGTNGAKGGNGSSGSTFDLPPVYIVVGSLEDAQTHVSLNSWNISYDFNGIKGGNGGNGGNGGKGGNGRSGKKWKSGFPGNFCDAGPGRGGNGGKGGNGGNGGDSASGGDGSGIAFFGTQAVVDVLTIGDINNYGASPGAAGKKGLGGDGGRYGKSGSSGNCNKRDDGKSGINGGDGKLGKKSNISGKRGEVVAYIVDNSDKIFNP